MLYFKKTTAHFFFLFIFLIQIFGETTAYSKTKTIWPTPQIYRAFENYFLINHKIFKFWSTLKSCDILENAFRYYYRFIFGGYRTFENLNKTLEKVCLANSKCIGIVNRLHVTIPEICEEQPYLGMNESYELSINKKNALLKASSVWGILRGLESFSQIIFRMKNQFAVNKVFIIDFPAFLHRGIMLDTSRHYLPKTVILQNLVAMAMNKFNVFHWHIVDDQSFPYQSLVFPELSEKGAYDPKTHIYTHSDIHEIVEKARLKGIRVIVEFDTPGHTEAIGKVKTDLLTKCKRIFDDVFVEKSPPLDPTKKETYDFLKKILAELSSLFPDKYIHLGGDEINYECWQSVLHKSIFELSTTYFNNLLNITRDINKIPIIWQDVLENGFVLPNNTVIVQIWKPGEYVMKRLVEKGYFVIFSSCWYFNYVKNEHDWEDFFDCRGLKFLEESYRKYLIGGEGCIWGEYVDGSNVLSRLWPRAIAAAEQLWSTNEKSYKDIEALHKQQCHMVRQGIPAAPIFGPSFCEVEYDPLTAQLYI